MDDEFYNKVGNDRIESRQIDELVGLARGIVADDVVNQAEIEFLQKWLVANINVSNHPVIRTLYFRIGEILDDGVADGIETAELLETLKQFSNRDFELGEIMKPASLPLCDPPPELTFQNVRYCFTGTFNFGQRKHCKEAILERGGLAGSLTQKTDILVIGEYATESWKHSVFGKKIEDACKFRDKGIPISIVSEQHWQRFL